MAAKTMSLKKNGYLTVDIEDTFLPKGFKVAVGNLYSSHYPRFLSRIQKDGMIGGEVSMWLIADEQILAKNGKLWDIMYLSEMLWNTDADIKELMSEVALRSYVDFA